MIRFLHLIAITGLIASAAYAYSIKYDTLYYAEEIQRQKTRLAREHDAIAVAKAEWALLTRPDRLQRMVEQHLDLQPIAVGQLARLSDLPNRPNRGDEIAKMLGALPAVAAKDPTPAPKRAAEQRAPAPPPAREDAIARLLRPAPGDAAPARPRRDDPLETGSIAPRPAKDDPIARLLGFVPSKDRRPDPRTPEWDPRAR